MPENDDQWLWFDDDEAEQFDTCLRSDSENETALFGKAAALHQLGRMNEAAEAYNKVLGKEPDSAEALQGWFRLGYWKVQQQDFRGGAEAFENCLKTRPDWTDAQLNAGICYWRQGDTARARTTLEKAHAAQPRSAEILRALTALIVEMDDLDKALAYQAKLDQLGDKTVELRYNLGLALLNAKRGADAVQAYKQTIQIDPTFAEAHLNLGHAFKATGLNEEAAAAWEKALSLKPELA